FLLNAQPATLLVGGKVFRLVPTGEVDSTRLITQVRNKAKAVAAVEAGAIRSNAITDSRVLISEAEERARVIRVEIDRLRAEAGARPPRWAEECGRGIKYNANNRAYYIALNIITYVEEIRYRVSEWQGTVYWN